MASSAITTITVNAAACQTIRAKVDFDGDGISDPAMFCPALGGASTWKYRASGNGNTLATLTLGSIGDMPVPADYDGDGKTDPAVYRPSTGVWYVAPSNGGYTPTTYSAAGFTDCTPLAEDFDGDGKADPTCYRPNGDWDVVYSTWISAYGNYGWHTIAAWGGGDMVPVVADFDGDGRADVTVFQGSTGAWCILYSSTAYQSASVYYWGGPGDVPMAGDYDGYGPSLTIYRPSTGTWYSQPHWSQFMGVWWHTFQWMASGDIPITGDFDGDGRLDPYIRHGDSWAALLTSDWWTTTRDVYWPANEQSPSPEPLEPSAALTPETGPPVGALTRSAPTTAGLSAGPVLEDASRDAAPSDEAASAPPAEVITFDPPMTAVTMTADLNGLGSGSVTASGFSCAGALTTCNGSFTSGASVTFTAVGTNGATFVGWSGACSGTSSTCTVTAADTLLAIATFTPAVSTTLYHHVDVLGSVRAISNSAGQTVERHDYKAFGEDVTTLPGAGNDARRFVGTERDSTGLDAMGARSYNMFQGRFTGVDPIINPGAIGNPQLWNRYAYALNNPLRFVDPSGLDAENHDNAMSMACKKGLRSCSGLVVVNTDARLNGAAWAHDNEEDGDAAGMLSVFELTIVGDGTDQPFDVEFTHGQLAAQQEARDAADAEWNAKYEAVVDTEMVRMFAALKLDPSTLPSRDKWVSGSGYDFKMSAEGFRVLEDALHTSGLFNTGPLGGAHGNLTEGIKGAELWDHRSATGAFGTGSVQAVLCPQTRMVHIDVDSVNAYGLFGFLSTFAHVMVDGMDIKPLKTR